MPTVNPYAFGVHVCGRCYVDENGPVALEPGFVARQKRLLGARLHPELRRFLYSCTEAPGDGAAVESASTVSCRSPPLIPVRENFQDDSLHNDSPSPAFPGTPAAASFRPFQRSPAAKREATPPALRARPRERAEAAGMIVLGARNEDIWEVCATDQTTLESTKRQLEDLVQAARDGRISETDLQE